MVYVCDNKGDFNDGYQSAIKIFAELPDVDSIFVLSDLVAIGALKYLNKAGIAIPRQIGIFGFSNWFMSSVISPKLTTINQPGFEIGKTAAIILFDEIQLKKENRPIIFQTVELEISIIERNST